MRSFLYFYKYSACIFSHISISRVNNTMNRNFPSLFLSLLYISTTDSYALLQMKIQFISRTIHLPPPPSPPLCLGSCIYLWEVSCLVVQFFTSFFFHRINKSHLLFLKSALTTISYVLSSKWVFLCNSGLSAQLSPKGTTVFIFTKKS